MRKAAELALADPAKAAKILADWIATPAGVKKSSAKSAAVRTKKSA